MRVGWMERRQVPLYLAALGVGASIGLLAPAAHRLEAGIAPVLGLLLYATFLGVPFAALGRAFRDGRFLTTVLVHNFVLVPVVVFLLSRLVTGDRVVLVGVLFVLLTPCVDYVIVFTGLAGGDKARLLAVAPLLMLVQLLLLPAYLWLMVGPDIVRVVDLEPFAAAFLLLIVLPLAAAGLTQLTAARFRPVRTVRSLATGAMVPLTMLTLAVVVASQISGVGKHLGALGLAICVYVLFAAVMVPIGMLVGRRARLDVAERRAVVFSGVTRNSLVILPLVLALPAAFDLAAIVVVTQTLVELVVMVILVRLVPALVTVPSAGGERGRAGL